jgi:hypothetical protein
MLSIAAVFTDWLMVMLFLPPNSPRLIMTPKPSNEGNCRIVTIEKNLISGNN